MSRLDSERYSRQIRFKPFGEAGQERLASARVGIAGCGALGSVQSELLARAGAGFLRIIDRDFVERSNLQRQFLFDEADAADALPKAVAAQRRLARINSSVPVEAAVADLVPGNIEDLLGDCTVILDGTDNFETRYLINDFAVSRGIPWIYGGAVGSYGITMPVMQGGACFRCMYPDPPAGVQPTCETAGVLGPVTSAVASLQVAAALKIIARGELAATVVTTLDLWSGAIRQLRQPDRDPDCPCCGRREFPYLEGRRRNPISLCGRNAVQIHDRSRPVDLQALAVQLSGIGDVRTNDFALRAHIDAYEMTVFPDGRAIIKGTTDTALARSLYARYIGN